MRRFDHGFVWTASLVVVGAGLLACVWGCDGGKASLRTASPDPDAVTNRLVVHVDDESKISVRESGAILWAQGTPARIDKRGRVTDRRGQLLAWLHEDNIRMRGGASIPIRRGTKGELFLSHKLQRDAELRVLEARIAEDGSIAAGEGRVATMRIAGKNSLQNRRLALLLLLLLHNDMLGSGAKPSGADGAGDGAGDLSEPDDSMELRPPEVR